MAGRIIGVIPKTKFSVNGAASSTNDIPLGPRAILTSDWTSGVLVVRLHSKATWASTTASLNVSVVNVSITPEDPNVTFQATGNIGQITVANSDQAPKLYEVAFSAPLGPMVAVVATLNQGASTGLCTWEMSVDLVGRDGLLTGLSSG